MRRGFTTMEVLSVIAIVAVLGGLSVPFWRNFLIRSDLHLAAEQTHQMLRRARILAQSGDTGAWGVYVPGGVLYQGTSYTTRNPNFDEVLLLPPSISSSGVQDVSFSALYSTPSTSGDIILEATNGDEVRIDITKLFGESIADAQIIPDASIVISFVEIINQGKGGATPTVHVGTATPVYEDGAVIPLTQNGEVILDDNLPYGVTGLAVQRFADHIIVLAQGELDQPGGKEIVDARITFTNATILNLENSYEAYPSENPFDGNASNGVGGDEMTQESSHSVFFQSRTTNYGDSIVIYWEPARARSPW